MYKNIKEILNQKKEYDKKKYTKIMNQKENRNPEPIYIYNRNPKPKKKENCKSIHKKNKIF